MTQNIYDNDAFFQEYSKLERSIEGLNGAVEWTSLRAMLPDLHGLRVVDLGCGFGWFCRWARQNRAAQVLGLDVSENMLARAQATTDDGAITYRQADLEHLTLPVSAFDLAYSSLVFHYIENLPGLLAEIYRALVPGGRLIFSIEHPIYTAPSNPDWISDAAGQSVWPLNNYQDEGARSTDWLAPGVIKQHRTMSTYINALIRSGFTLSYIEEWRPTEAQIADRPDRAIEHQRPPFLLVAAAR